MRHASNRNMDNPLPHEVLLDKVLAALKHHPTATPNAIRMVCQHFLDRLVANESPDWKYVADLQDFDYQFDVPESIVKEFKPKGGIKTPLDPKCKAFIAIDNNGAYVNHMYISDAATRYKQDFGIRARVNLLMKHNSVVNVESGAVFKDEFGACYFWLKKDLVNATKETK